MAQVSKLSDTWRTATNSKRSKQGGGFGGISSLEKKRQYRVREFNDSRQDGYGMVFDEREASRGGSRDHRYHRSYYESRSRSPQRVDRYHKKLPPSDGRRETRYEEGYDRSQRRRNRSRRR